MNHQHNIKYYIYLYVYTRLQQRVPTCLLDVQLARPDAVDELGGLGGHAVGLDQKVLVEVPHPAAGLQFGVGGGLPPAVGLQVHEVLQGAAFRPLGERGELVGAGLLVPGHWTDGDRWRT